MVRPFSVSGIIKVTVTLNRWYCMSNTARRYTRKMKIENGEEPPKLIKTLDIVAQSERQREYLTALKDSDLVFAVGCAGTGKTYIAASMAAQLYLNRKIRKIVITRPNVTAGGKGIGFFPGTLEEKMAPWVAPVIDVLRKHLGSQKVEAMMKAGEIVIEPFETMRGKSFEDAFVLLDEAQNTTYDELKMFLTRLGKNCLTVVDGDVSQSDLKQTSGLKRILHMVKNQMLPFPLIEFSEKDIVRSDICAMWIRAFIKEESPRAT